MADLTLEQVEQFAAVVRNPAASSTLKSVAEHILTVYLRAGGEKGEGAKVAGEEYLRIRARNDVDAFSEYVFGFTPVVHHREMTRVLNDPRRKRTVIVAPPGSAKSHYVSLVYPTFMAAKYPNEPVMILTETSTQAERFSSQIRPLLEGSNEPGKRLLQVFPEVVPDKEAGWTRENLYLANRTKIFKEPNLFFAGVGSTSIQGVRSALQLYDDIVGPKMIRSPVEMYKIREDLRNLIVPRLYPDGRIVVVMTRWAANDLLELFTHEMDFEVVHMPALSDDPRGAYCDFIPSRSYLRYPKPGDRGTLPQWVKHPDGDKYVEDQIKSAYKEAVAAGFACEITTSAPNYDLPCLRKFLHPEDKNPVLWPEWFDFDALSERQSTTPVSFRLVFNGDPTGVSGDVFKREQFLTYGGEDDTFKRVPVDCRYFMTVDVAVGGSKKGRGDYFVCLTVAVDDFGNKFIVDCLRSNEILPPQQRKALIDLYRNRFPQTLAIIIEATNYQSALVHELEQEGLPVVSYKPTKNKDVRIEASTVYWAQGKIFLPYNAAWTAAFIDEHTQYPRGKHDDQIDAGAQLWEFLSTYSMTPQEYEINFG